MKMRVFLFVKAALLSLPAIEDAARRNRINIWSEPMAPKAAGMH